MRILHPDDLRPLVRMVNFHPVPPGASWGSRTIADLELILNLTGEFEFFTDAGERIVQRPGQVLLIYPTERHTYRRSGAAGRAMFSCIHCELLPAGQWAAKDYRLEPSPRRLTDVAGDREIPRLFRRAARAFGGYSRFRQEIVSTIVREIWLRLAEKWSETASPAVSRRMEQMLAFLRDRLGEPVSRRDLAEAFAVTPEHVNYLFRKELGLTPTQFVHRERALLAYRLIREQGLSVKQAAAAVGFADPFHFSRVFKRVLGVPPSRV